MSSTAKPIILFDGRHISNRYSGLGRYTLSILITLISHDELYNKLIIICDNEDLINEIDTKGYNVEIIKVRSKLFGLMHHFCLPFRLIFIKHDIYFYPHFDLPFLYFRKSIFVIHDLKYLKLENQILKYKNIKKFLFKFLIRFNVYKSNSKCICVSRSTKTDVLEIVKNKYGNKISVVYEDTFLPINQNFVIRDLIKELIQNNKEYLFYIGDRRPHKNLNRTIDIFNIITTEYNLDISLIIAGSTKNYNFNVDDYIKDSKRIILLGNVNDLELEYLYRNMLSLLYLSKYEGFGLPILEAAKYEKRIIASNNSSLPEVCPPSALMVDLNKDNYLIAKEIFHYLKNSHNQEDNKMHLSMFSWDKSVCQIFGL